MIDHDEAARLASVVLDLRRRRADHLPADLFGEPAWGILLSLFVADAAGDRITATEAFRRSGAVDAVASRWMTVLERRGLVACEQACDDGHVVALTPAGVHAVELCMEDAQALMSCKP